jgi:hypothetical protein
MSSPTGDSGVEPEASLPEGAADSAGPADSAGAPAAANRAGSLQFAKHAHAGCPGEPQCPH